MVGRTRGELGGAGVDGLVDRAYAEGPAHPADHVLAEMPQTGDLGVGQAVPLGGAQYLGGQLGGGADVLGDLGDEQQLVDEPRVDAGRGVQLIDSRSGQQSPHHHAQPAIVRPSRPSQQRFDLADMTR